MLRDRKSTPRVADGSSGDGGYSGGDDEAGTAGTKFW